MSFDFYKQVLHGVCFENKFSGMLQKCKIYWELFFKGVNSVWKLCCIYSLKEKQIPYQPSNCMQFHAPV